VRRAGGERECAVTPPPPPPRWGASLASILPLHDEVADEVGVARQVASSMLALGHTRGRHALGQALGDLRCGSAVRQTRLARPLPRPGPVRIITGLCDS
jgi:hypothetical protein